MSDKHFVDTNILIYAHDKDAGWKHRSAADLILDLWESGTGVLSTQVLQEFYVIVTRKVKYPIHRLEARRLIRNYLEWEVVINNGPVILHAVEIEENHHLSFWDALIVAAAYSKNAGILFTEDLNDGQQIEGITIQNPLTSKNDAGRERR